MAGYDAALVARVRAALAAAGDPERAAGQQRYLRSAMPCHGITSPERHRILTPVLRAHPPPDRATWERTVREPVGRRDARTPAGRWGEIWAEPAGRVPFCPPVFRSPLPGALLRALQEPSSAILWISSAGIPAVRAGSGPMRVGEAINRCGGRATWRMLRALGVRRCELEAALLDGSIVRVRRGHFRSPNLDTALDTATAVTGVLSHRSAALHLGLEVVTVPDRPEVIVGRHRRLSVAHRQQVSPFYRDLAPDDVRGGATTPLRTVLDCARDLPLTESLAVADSALRHGAVTTDQLRKAAGAMSGPRSVAALRVAREAHVMAANAFESSLRAIALEAGLDVVPQVQVTDNGLFAMVDLADAGRRLVVEAESFEFHASRRGFRKDVRRYTELEVFGWTVLRFTWEDVTLQPHYVRWALESWRRWYDEGVTVGAPPAHLPRLA